MLAQLLEKRGIGARIEGTAALSMSNVVPTDGVAMVCLSYLDTTSSAHMRYMIRRARRKWPDARILLGCWLADGNAASLVATLKADAMALTLRDAVKSCLAAAQGEDATGARARTAFGGRSQRCVVGAPGGTQRAARKMAARDGTGSFTEASAILNPMAQGLQMRWSRTS